MSGPSPTPTPNRIGAPMPVIYPSPAILQLFEQYSHPFPVLGPSTFEAIQLTPTLVSLDIEDKMSYYLSDVAKKWKATTAQPVALSLTTITNGQNVQSDVLNFYAISGNQLSNLLSQEQSNAIGNLLTAVVQTYNVAALQYLTSILTNHEAQIGNNPHNDHIPYQAYQDTLIQFYTRYNQMFPNTFTLAQFIAVKGTPLIVATSETMLTDSPAEAAVTLVPVIAYTANFALHADGTADTIHPALTALFMADDKLPTPMMNVVPELSAGWYFETGTSPGPFYQASPLYDELPRNTGTMLIEATINPSDQAFGQTVVQFTCSTTQDVFTLGWLQGATQPSYQLTVGSQTWNGVLQNVTTNLIVVFSWTANGFTLMYVDDTGTQQTITVASADFYMNFDQIQIGVPLVRYPPSSVINSLQCLRVYAQSLDATQLNLLLQPSTV